KGTLMVALLRAAGIPARQVFVDIDARILRGIVDPGTLFVDHSYVELLLDDVWLATDAYIVDQPLFEAAQKRLASENTMIGYGVHSLGTNEFDEKKPSFSQFKVDGHPSLTTRHYGIHADVSAFYAATPETWNRLRFLTRRAFPVFAMLANRNTEKLRSS
ncbi:MAG: transglutaminase domain-containing protein, partial [Notoacmeibacter sp.]